MGFRPAMELVEADGDVGVVVAQEPPGGSLVARSALVTLFIAAPAGREGAAATAGDSARSEGAAERHLHELEAEDRGLVRVAEDDGVIGREAALGDDGGLGTRQDLDAAGSIGEGEAEGELRAGRELAGGGEAFARRARGRRLVRVRWLLVIGGWQVWWVEGMAAAAVALLAAWAAAGTRALAGVAVAVAVLLVPVAWAAIADSRRATASERGVGGAAETDRRGRMLVDLDRQGGLDEGRADENG